jgi:hypothetical protein
MYMPITLVCGDQARKGDAAAKAAADDVGAQSAALGNDADLAHLARADLGEGNPSARGVNAQAVGSEQAHSAGARRRRQFILQRPSFIHLAEAARDHLRKTHATGAGCQQRGDLRGRDRDVGIVHWLRRVAQALVCRQPIDFGRGGMDGIDRAFITEFANTANEDIGQRRALGRSAHHRDGLRRE